MLSKQLGLPELGDVKKQIQLLKKNDGIDIKQINKMEVDYHN